MDDKNENTNTDSNINSWIFIEKNTSNVNNEYCFKDQISAVQELSKEDLGNAECNSDSDEISIISETDDSNDQEEYCTCSTITKNHDIVSIQNNTSEIICKERSIANCKDVICVEKSEVISNDPTSKNKIIFISTLTGLCFLATYLFWPKTVNPPKYMNDIIINYDNDYLDTEFNEVIDNVYEIIKDDINNTCNFDETYGNSNIIFFPDDKFMYQTLDKNKESSVPVIIQQLSFKNNKQENKANVENKDFKKNVNGNKIHTKTSKSKDAHQKSKIIKDTDNYLKKKDKYLIKKEKYLKKLEKDINQLETRLRQTYKQIKKEMENFEKHQVNKEKKHKMNYKKSVQNVTGDWYDKMHSGRSEIRYKEKLSDWVFERSKRRNKLRNEESWYLNRMKGREQIRLKKKLQSNKNKIYEAYRY